MTAREGLIQAMAEAIRQETMVYLADPHDLATAALAAIEARGARVMPVTITAEMRESVGRCYQRGLAPPSDATLWAAVIAASPFAEKTDAG